MLYIPLILITATLFLLSINRRLKNLVIINLLNAFLTTFYVYYTGNVIPDLFQNSFTEDSGFLKGFEFQVYLGNVQLSLALLIVIINIWSITIWELLKTNNHKK